MSTLLITEHPTHQTGTKQAATKQAQQLANAKTGDILAVKFEEEAIVWLWAKPSLLPWPRPVEWLFSPITGNKEWPGDLWGVDEDGELLIIENKILKRSGHHYDPFRTLFPTRVSRRFAPLARSSKNGVTCITLR
jgi:hypothetical protein